MDRTSDLPIYILEHILSFLPVDDAARISTFSSAWSAAWSSLTVFSFEFKSFDRKTPAITENFEESLEEEEKRLMKFIRVFEIMLGRQKAVVNKFSFQLVLQDFEKFIPHINGIIELVTRKYARELDLRIRRRHEQFDSSYPLPCAALAGKSLVVLKLSNFKLEGSLVADNSNFSCLRELHLFCVKLDDKVMCQLLQSSPALEEFTVALCCGFNHLLIPNLSKLRKVWLAGQLTLLENRNQRFEKFKIEAERLKELSLGRIEMSDELFENLVSELPLLQHLSLDACSDLKRVKVSGGVLKKLQLQHLNDLQEAIIDAPNLIFYGFSGSRLPPIFKFNASSLQEAVLRLCIEYPINTSWFHNLRQYLASFEQHTNVTLSLNYKATIYFLTEELQEFSVPQLPAVKHITIRDITYLPSASFETLLDGLFWCCHPEHVRLQLYSSHRHDFVPEKLLDTGVHPQCCNSSSIKCWRHFLIGIENVVPTDDQHFTKFCFDMKWKESACWGDTALNQIQYSQARQQFQSL